MKKTNYIITTALVAAFTLVGVSMSRAEDAPQKDTKPAAKKKADPAAKFAKLDADKNGSISKEEFSAKAKDAAKAEAAFAKKDANKDGSLSPEEFAAGGGKKKEKKAKPAAAE